MHPLGHRADLGLVVAAALVAGHLLGRDLEHEVIGRDAAVGERDADPRVGEFTGKDAAAASVDATVAVLERAALVAFVATRARRRADSRRGVAAVARGRRLSIVDSARAAVVGLAHVQRARDVTHGAEVGHDNAVLVQLRTSDRGRLSHPALGIAVRRAVGRLDGTEAERRALGQAAAVRARHAHLSADRAGLEHKRGLRLLVDERERLAGAVGVERAREREARLDGREASALGGRAHLLRLEERDGDILQDVAERVGALEAVVVELLESRRSHLERVGKEEKAFRVYSLWVFIEKNDITKYGKSHWSKSLLSFGQRPHVLLGCNQKHTILIFRLLRFVSVASVYPHFI